MRCRSLENVLRGITVLLFWHVNECYQFGAREPQLMVGKYLSQRNTTSNSMLRMFAFDWLPAGSLAKRKARQFRYVTEVQYLRQYRSLIAIC